MSILKPAYCRDDYMTGDNGYGFAFTSEDLSFGFHYEF